MTDATDHYRERATKLEIENLMLTKTLTDKNEIIRCLEEDKTVFRQRAEEVAALISEAHRSAAYWRGRAERAESILKKRKKKSARKAK